MDASPPISPVASGTYRLVPWTGGDLAKMDAWTVELTVISTRYATTSETAASSGVMRLRPLAGRVVGGLETLSEAGAECAIIDGASDLKQPIGAASRPSHLLRFVHPTVHQEIGRPFGDRGANPQSGAMPLGIVDQPIALTNQITIQRLQGGP